MHLFFAQNRITDYLEGDLPASDLADFEVAMAEHPELAEEVEMHRLAQRLIKEQGQHRAPPELHAQIMEAIEDDCIHRRRRRHKAAAWSVLALAAGLAIFVTSNPMDNMLDGMDQAQVITPNRMVLPLDDEVVSPVPTVEPLSKASPQNEMKEPTKTKPTFKSKPKRTVKFTPETIYIPEWERTENIKAEAEPEAPSFPVQSLKLRATRGDILIQLKKLADLHHGTLYGSTQQPLSPYKMDEYRQFQFVDLVIPEEQFTTIKEALGRMGVEIRRRSLQSVDGQIKIPLEVSYQTGF
jgi:hypothetical protein